MKDKTGYTYEENGRLYARLTYTDETGRRRNVKRRAENAKHGKAILKDLREQFDKGGARAVDTERMTVNDLCDFYCEHYLKPAEYVKNRKVFGLRSQRLVGQYISLIRNQLGSKRLRLIAYSDLLNFRNSRFETPTKHEKQRSLATVNRELCYLRRLLNIAERERWIYRNPFRNGDSLINISDETKRNRTLSKEEEVRLLNICNGRRAHLKPIIILALDTGMRRGEILKLRWHDIDFDQQLITIQAFNTKTMRQRVVSMTVRVYDELSKLWSESSEQESALVFGIADTFKTAFNGACKTAQISDLRFHDLRHTHATRLDGLGFSLAKIGTQLGHTQVQTTLRYVNRTFDEAKRMAEALDVYRSPMGDAVQISAVVQ
jgi:integrase